MTQRQQPKVAVIDWGNPITKNLVSAVSGNNTVLGTGTDGRLGTDLVHRSGEWGISGTGASDPKIINTDIGWAISNAHDERYYFANDSLTCRGKNEYSIFGLFNVAEHASNGAMPIGEGETATSTDHKLCLKVYSGSIVVAAKQYGQALDSASIVETIPTNTWLGAVCTFDSNGTQDIKIFYKPLFGGIVQTASTGLDTSDPIEYNLAGSTTMKLLNGSDGDVTREFDGHIALGACWDRPLSAREAQSLLFNPWQIFKPQRIVMPIFPYDPTVVLEEAGPTIINESISFDITADTTQINILSAAASQTFTINIVQDQTGDVGAPTVTITLVDSVGTPLQNLTGLSWAWFDESTPGAPANAPTAQGTNETTDSSGELVVDITGTTLTTGQTGMLALRDSTGNIYALYRITL